MPELPDVEVRRRLIQETSLNKEIKKVSVLEKRILGNETTPSILSRELCGSIFLSANRRGKYLLLSTSKKNTLLLHLGMTGDIIFVKKGEEKPKWSRVEFYFANGSCLHYTNMRLIGKVALFKTTNPSSIPDIAKLGPEPLERSFTFKKFEKIVKSHSTTIHQLLMEQELIAGIGNIYSDEIAFQAGVRPDKNTKSLTEEEIRQVYKKMKWVLRVAIELGAELDPYPRRFLIPNRDRKGLCPRDSNKIMKKTIGGRSSYFCPLCQK
ncbi:MAG: DNA-formamidopyrimidine glycosylase [Actinomycetota bacterium]|nr:DNA-formamidopyrimidine glycosylase [Actinomycetota bacterium]